MWNSNDFEKSGHYVSVWAPEQNWNTAGYSGVCTLEKRLADWKDIIGQHQILIEVQMQ